MALQRLEAVDQGFSPFQVISGSCLARFEYDMDQ